MQLLFSRSSVEACIWQQTAFLTTLSVKLRLVDWIRLTGLAFSRFCGRVLVFLLHKVVEER